MSKNMTRKGLAIGSAMALGVSALVAQPAAAVDYVTTGLTSGTSLNSLTGETNELSLTTNISALVGGTDDGKLKYRIQNPGEASLAVTVGNTTAVTLVKGTTTGAANGHGTFFEYTKAVALNDGGALGSFYDVADNDVVLALYGTDVIGEYTENNILTVGVKDATATDVTLTVTAWIDIDGDNTIDSTEYVGPATELKFYDETSVTATVSVNAPVLGADNVTATISTSPELNGQQLGANAISGKWVTQGNANKVLDKDTLKLGAAGAKTDGGSTYNGTTKVWTSTIYLPYALKATPFDGAAVVKAQIDLVAAAPAPGTFTYAAADGVALITSNAHGFTDNQVVLLAATATDDAGVAGDESDLADALDGYFAVDSAAANTFEVATGSSTAHVADALENTSTADLYAVPSGDPTVVASGTYSAEAFIGSLKVGAAAAAGSSPVTANDAKASIAGSNDVQAAANATGASETNVKVRSTQKTVSATATIYYADANGVQQVAPAGVPVTGYLTNVQNSAVLAINGNATSVSSDTELTDANGQVTFTIVNSSPDDGDGVDLEIRPQSLASGAATTAEFDIDWADASYTLYDLKDQEAQPSTQTVRSITKGGTYTFNFALLDQWKVAAPSDTWRLQVVNADRTVSSDYHTLTNGKVNVTVADAAQGANAYITTTVNVQKLVTGTWQTQAALGWDGTGIGTVKIHTIDAQTDKVTLDASGAQLYEYNNSASVNALFVADIAVEDVAAQDRRVVTGAQEAYDNGAGTAETVTIHGRVADALTGAARPGAEVTISGDSSILFSSGLVDAFGSITVIASSEGDFTVNAFSNTSQTNSVVTITTADGASKTQKITFNAVAATSGASVEIAAPTNALPGSTFTVTVTVKDKYGNPVNTGTNDQLLISYTGPGIVFGTLPDDTNSKGIASFAVLLGSNDKGSAAISVTLDQSNNNVFTDAIGATTDDITATAAITVGTAAASSDQKVNAGSFKGYVAVYAKGYEGKRLSAKVGADWVVVPVLASNFVRVVEYTGAGYTIAVRIYIDRVLVDTITVTTK